MTHGKTNSTANSHSGCHRGGQTPIVAPRSVGISSPTSAWLGHGHGVPGLEGLARERRTDVGEFARAKPTLRGQWSSASSSLSVHPMPTGVRHSCLSRQFGLDGSPGFQGRKPRGGALWTLQGVLLKGVINHRCLHKRILSNCCLHFNSQTW